MNTRLNYKNSEVIKLSDYILNNIPKNSKLAISQGVLIPKTSNQDLYNSCHWWKNCGLLTQLKDFAPDYLIFIDNINYNGVKPINYLNFIEYIRENNFQFMASIGQFSIYKKL